MKCSRSDNNSNDRLPGARQATMLFTPKLLGESVECIMKKLSLLKVLAAVLLLAALTSACSKETGHNNNGTGAHTENGTDKPAIVSADEGMLSGGHGNHGGSHNDHAMKAEDQVKASFTFDSEAPIANEETELTITVSGEDGMPISDFTENHEKLLHLIIVDHSLGYFNHIHPAYEGGGKFTIRTTFPAGGEYKMFADFMPAGGSGVTKSDWVEVSGESSSHSEVKPDKVLVKEEAGKEVELQMNSSKAGEEVKLSFHIRAADSRKEITNLEPYLGAVGHVVILSEDAEEYIHVHPIDEHATGPVASFATMFPKTGVYKIWGQFQHEGNVFTVPYVVNVTE